MEKIKTRLPFPGLLLMSYGASLFLNLRRETPSMTFTDHGFTLFSFRILIFTALIYGAVFIVWRAAALTEARILSRQPHIILWEDFLDFLPAALFLFSPWLLRFYLTSDDLSLRLDILGILVLAAVLLLKISRFYNRFRGASILTGWLERLDSRSKNTKGLALFFIAFIIYHLCTFVLVSSGVAFSGDEPYYLLTANSIYQDLDINLANDYAERDYFNFYPRESFPDMKLTPYARFGKEGQHQVWPISQPGISALIQPHYWLSRMFQGRTRIYVLKAGLALWAALLSLQLYLFAKETWRREGTALGIWALYAFSAPVLFYASHIYPEVVAALCAFYVFRRIRANPPRKTIGLFFLGFPLGLLFWFGLKYNTIFWPLLLVSLYFLIRVHRIGRKAAVFLFWPLTSLVLFYLYVHQLYGTFSPIAIYEGVMTPDKMRAFWETARSIPVMLRLDSFFDYFLDQRDGLLLYSPIYFFFFPGLIEAFRRRRSDFFSLLLIVSPFLLNYAFFTHRQGYSPQGRVLMPISWVGAIFIGYWLVHNKKTAYSSLFRLAAGTGAAFAVLCLRHPSFLYQPTTHEFTFRGGALFLHLSNIRFDLSAFLPSFIKVNNLGYLPNYFWLGGILLFTGGYLLKARNGKRRFQKIRGVLLPGAGLTLLFFWLVLFPRTRLLFPTPAEYSAGRRVAFYNLDRAFRMRNPGEFEILRDRVTRDLDFTSWRPVESLRITLEVQEGEYETKISLFDQVLFEGRIADGDRTLVIPSPASYRYKNINLYRLHLEILNLSAVRTAEFPLRLTVQPDF